MIPALGVVRASGFGVGSNPHGGRQGGWVGPPLPPAGVGADVAWESLREEDQMAKLTFDQAADGLRSWAKTLLNRLDGAVTEAKAHLKGGSPLPPGCPSKESMAAMALSKLGS